MAVHNAALHVIWLWLYQKGPALMHTLCVRPRQLTPQFSPAYDLSTDLSQSGPGFKYWAGLKLPPSFTSLGAGPACHLPGRQGWAAEPIFSLHQLLSKMRLPGFLALPCKQLRLANGHAVCTTLHEHCLLCLKMPSAFGPCSFSAIGRKRS